MTITLTREEAQQVLDALEEAKNLRIALWQNGCDCGREHTCNPMRDKFAKQFHEAGETLRARLAQPEPYKQPEDNRLLMQAYRAVHKKQPEPEPVAKVVGTSDHEGRVRWCQPQRVELDTLLYAAPPQREWQGLTDEEITALKRNGERYISSQDFARAIEAKLKEKNT